MTLEDPVEYPMEMIRQTSVNEAVRLTFANGVRSMMRQDPDIILVGEIRDEETALMAFRAAMTASPGLLDAAHEFRPGGDPTPAGCRNRPRNHGGERRRCARPSSGSPLVSALQECVRACSLAKAPPRARGRSGCLALVPAFRMWRLRPHRLPGAHRAARAAPIRRCSRGAGGAWSHRPRTAGDGESERLRDDGGRWGEARARGDYECG